MTLMIFKRNAGILLSLILVIGVSGCGTKKEDAKEPDAKPAKVAAKKKDSFAKKMTSWFRQEDNGEPPSPLVKFEPTIKVNKLWSDRYGKGTDELYLNLEPAIYGDLIFTADRDGRVIAVDAGSGKVKWEQRDKKELISGGPGVGDDLVFVGTSDAAVVARDIKTGEIRWSAKVSSEILAAPRAAEGMVVVRTGDGKLFGLDSATGHRKWIYDRAIPVLTLRGTGAPIIHNGLVLAGFDNGRLIALELTTGKLAWEARLAEPSGRSELERLVDVDGEPVIVGDTAYIASFQGRVAAVSVSDGRIEWTRDISSYADLAVDDDHVYVTDDTGGVWALDRADGHSIWKQDALKARRLTGPGEIGGYVVVGDFEGYLHWLRADTGGMVNRIRIDKQRILSSPLKIDGALVAYSSSGEMAAYRPE